MDDFLYITNTDEKSLSHLKQQSDRRLSWQLRMREWLELNKISVNTSIQSVVSRIQSEYPGMINDPNPLSAGYYTVESAPSIELKPSRTLMACIRDWWRYQQLVKQAAVKIQQKTVLDFNTVTFHNIKTHHLTVLIIDTVTEVLPVFGIEMKMKEEKDIKTGASKHKEKEKEEDDEYTATRKQLYTTTLEWLRMSSNQKQYPVMSLESSSSPMMKDPDDGDGESLDIHESIESFAFAKEPSELYTKMISLIQHAANRVNAWRSTECVQIRQQINAKYNEASAAEQKASSALSSLIKSTSEHRYHSQRVAHELSEITHFITQVNHMESVIADAKVFPSELINGVSICKTSLDQSHSDLQDEQLQWMMDAHPQSPLTPLWTAYKQSRINSFMWTWLQLRVGELDAAIMIQNITPDWDKTYSPHLGKADLLLQRGNWGMMTNSSSIDAASSQSKTPDWKIPTVGLLESYNTFVTKTLAGQSQQLQQSRAQLLSQLGCMFGTKDPFGIFNHQRLYAYISHFKTKLSSLRMKPLDDKQVVGDLLNAVNSQTPTHPHIFLDRVVLIVTLCHV